MTPWMIRNKFSFPNNHLSIHLIRSLAFLFGGLALLSALDTLPLTIVIMITYTSPIFVCVGAVFLFKERMSILHLVSLIMSIVGVNVLFAGEKVFDFIGITLALVATVMLTIAQLSLKWLSLNEDKVGIFVTQLLFTLLPFALLQSVFGKQIELSYLPLIAIMASSFALSQLLLIEALSQKPLSKLMPLDAIRLVVTTLGGILLFEEMLSLQIIIGAAIVLCSVTLVMKTK